MTHNLWQCGSAARTIPVDFGQLFSQCQFFSRWRPTRRPVLHAHVAILWSYTLCGGPIWDTVTHKLTQHSTQLTMTAKSVKHGTRPAQWKHYEAQRMKRDIRHKAHSTAGAYWEYRSLQGAYFEYGGLQFVVGLVWLPRALLGILGHKGSLLGIRMLTRACWKYGACKGLLGIRGLTRPTRFNWEDQVAGTLGF